jgi:hypothetical protein
MVGFVRIILAILRLRLKTAHEQIKLARKLTYIITERKR